MIYGIRYLSNTKTAQIVTFLYLYITRRTINYNTPHLKSPKNQTEESIKLLEGEGAGLEPISGRPTLALDSALVHQTKQLQMTRTKRIKHKQEAKAGGHTARMLYKTNRHN